MSSADRLAKILASAKARLADGGDPAGALKGAGDELADVLAAAKATRTGPEPTAEQARALVTGWLDRHHVPSRTELTALRAVLHAAVTEGAQLDACCATGAKLVAAAEEIIAATPALDTAANQLLGMMVKYRATVTRGRTEIDGQRRAAAQLLRNKAGGSAKKPGRAKFKGRGKAVN